LVNAEKQRLITDKRLASDSDINEILTHLPDDARAAGETLRSAWEAVKSLRPDVDRDLSLDPAQRDSALAEQWLAESNRLVASLENLLVSISNFSGNTDATFARLSDLRVLALKLRVIAGAESHLFASELSSTRTLPRKVLDALHQLRGRSLQIESQLFPGMLALSDPAATIAVARVKSELFGRLHALQDELIRTRENGVRASDIVENYLVTSLAALDSTIELSNAINGLAETHVRNRLEQARAQSVTSMSGIAAILLLGCFAALVMAIRFTRPLNEVLRRIDRLLRAHLEVLHPEISTANHDEFAKVQQALQFLDEAIEARWKSEAALHESERISASILSRIPQSIIATDLNGVITVFSAGAEAMLGYSAAEVVGRQTPLIFHDPEELRGRAEQLSKQSGMVVSHDFKLFVQQVETNASPDEREWSYLRKNGERIAVLLSVNCLKNANGEVDGYLGVASDITERKRFENISLENAREKEKQNNLLNALLETIPVGVFMVEAPSGNPLVANDAARLLLGRGLLPEVHKDKLAEVYAAYKMPSRIPYPVGELPLVRGMQGESSRVDDMLVVSPDGTERILEVMGCPVRDSEGRVWASVVSFIDITGRAQSTAKMTRLAHYDSLTGLPNRRLFHDRMQVAITQARRDKSRLALLMIDLDRFKPVNDNLGHAVGDLLLKAVAGRMQLCLRESDTLARVGG
ncbi:MAG: diguanylate cyclase, partial [Betaproteobacteria bacterium]